MSKVLDFVHNSAKSLYDLNIIDVTTMHEFDALCLKDTKIMKPREIKKLRLREHVSQPVFAKYLNVSASTIKKWETGENIPNGTATRLLNIIEQNGINIIQ